MEVIKRDNQLIVAAAFFYKKRKAGVDGGALNFVVFLLFMFGILLAGILLYVRYQHMFLARQNGISQVGQTINSAIELYSMQPSLLSDDDVMLDVFSDSSAMVKVERKHWGAFELLKMQCYYKSYSESRNALVGEAYGSGPQLALYVPDKNKYLSISGKSEVRGHCYLSQLGLRAGHIEGYGFEGYLEKRDTHIKQSKNSLPFPNPHWMESILSYMGNRVEAERYPAQKLGAQSGQYVSFAGPTIGFENPEEQWRIGNVELAGKIMLYASGEVIISSGATLEQIIICAKKITIEAGFKGCVQAFACDTLVVEPNVHLQYPSVALVYNKQADSQLLDIKQNCVIDGLVLACAAGEEQADWAQVRIAKNVHINGQLYCKGKLTLQGDVNGTTAAELFTLKTPAALYENHLLDVHLNAENLPPDFACAPVFCQYSEKQFIQWVQ